MRCVSITVEHGYCKVVQWNPVVVKIVTALSSCPADGDDRAVGQGVTKIMCDWGPSARCRPPRGTGRNEERGFSLLLHQNRIINIAP